MVRIKKGTNTNRNNMGIHLFDPSKRQIEDAKEDAQNKGFSAVYIHRTRKLIVKR